MNWRSILKLALELSVQNVIQGCHVPQIRRTSIKLFLDMLDALDALAGDATVAAKSKILGFQFLLKRTIKLDKIYGLEYILELDYHDI